MPCCHDFGGVAAARLSGWIDRRWPSTSRRALDLERRGYDVWTQAIPPEITPKHRLLGGSPARPASLKTAPAAVV